MKKMSKYLAAACAGMLLATALAGCGGDKKQPTTSLKSG